ncbi:MAG: DUF362 domain-containing protein [Acidobacteria bacterium]|nr:DUF362 domain-containing protein [Acidobacteriota bacterium]
MRTRRRDFLVGAAGLGIGGAIRASSLLPKYRFERRPKRSRVAIVSVNDYSEKIVETLVAALGLFSLDVRNKSVVLKPNLVDCAPGQAINTHPSLVLAAAEAFLLLGARSIVVADGPGHERDTQRVLSESGYEGSLAAQGLRFVDLNRDHLLPVRVKAAYTGIEYLWLPRTVLAAEFLVSMPKLKTHHWSGVTLSMKNLFGIVPGIRYGWPKNILHWKGISESILDICATVPIHFVIVDGIVGMEGNGPLQGTPRMLGKVILSDDPVAADATCARLMGLEPGRVPHLREGSKFLGNCTTTRVEQIAETLVPPRTPFELVPEWGHLVA